MAIPTYLKSYARQFYRAHHDQLVADDTLDPSRDEESFCILCDLYGILRMSNPMGDSREALRYVSVLKQFQAFAKQFGLMPKDRNANKPDADPLKKLLEG